MIATLVWRNIWRNKRRTLITISSIAFAMILSIVMQSLKDGAFDNLIHNLVGYYSGYIQVHKKGYWKERVIEHAVHVDKRTIDELSQIQAISTIVPRLESFILMSTGEMTKGCIIIGTDPELEEKMTGLDKKIIRGHYLSKDKAGILVAEGLALRMKLDVGDTVVLLGQGYRGSTAAGKYPISGIVYFSAPQMNNQFMYLPLKHTQELFGVDSLITGLAIQLHDSHAMHSVQKDIIVKLGSEYEVMNWEEMMPEIANHIQSDTVSMSIFSGVLYVMIGFGFLGTIVMMISERKKEFGMLIAIGMNKKLIQYVLASETILISLIGAISGNLISIPIVAYLTAYPIRFTGEFEKAFIQFGFEPIFPAIFDISIFINQSVIVLCLSILVGMYPIWHIHRLSELRAMK